MFDLASVSVFEALAAVAVLVVPQMRARRLDYVIDHCNPTLRLHADAEKLQQILLGQHVHGYAAGRVIYIGRFT